MSEKLIGKNLDGRYVLEEVLGSGATGAVFRATQTAVDRVVAIKTLHPFLQDREDFQQRFEIEAKAIARLNHPNLITLYDFGYDKELDVFYMAVEYIRGTLLADMMAESLPYDEVTSICYQVAEALEHAHREGILHRDLKPENIMIQRSTHSGRPIVKVLDFGLARLYETTTEGGVDVPTGRYKQITQVGEVYGTPAYMSPEQCRAREELTAATDLYALGTMMYELFEGHLPFSAQSTAELILMQLTEEPPRMTRLDVPVDIKNLVHAMMAKDPAARPPSAKIVQLALLAHVRLDASQEMRIVPSESGEYRAIPSGEFRAIPSGEYPAPRFGAGPSSLDLSQEELRVATTTQRNSLVALAVGALVLGFLGAMVVFALRDAGEPAAAQAAEAAEPAEAAAVVDGQRKPVADSPTSEGESVAQVQEPSEPDEEDRKAAQKQRRKKQKSKSSPKKSEKTEEPAGRAKTLKLTY